MEQINIITSIVFSIIGIICLIVILKIAIESYKFRKTYNKRIDELDNIRNLYKKHYENEKTEINIVLNHYDFVSLIRGDYVGKSGAKIILLDIGFDKMIEIIRNVRNEKL